MIENHHIKHLQNFVKIISAAMNAFRPPLITDKPDDLAEAELMLLSASHDNNALKERVQTGALSSRGGKWVSIDALDAASDFPELADDYLRSISYQPKQA